MEKTSREYAEKLALECLKETKERNVEFDSLDFIYGYLTAIDKTNVKSLEAEVKKLRDALELMLEKSSVTDNGVVNKAITALGGRC